MKFTKMHGLGNDYVYINGFEYPESEKNAEKLAKYLSLPHIGIGADGVILVLPPTVKDADFRMRIFNSDGSEGKMCGNGIRCVGKFVYDNGLTKSKNIKVETLSGIKNLTLFTDAENQVSSVEVDMGAPKIFGLRKLMIFNRLIEGYQVSVGNPHFVVLSPQMKENEIADYGKALEYAPAFAPERTNVEFLNPIDTPNAIRVRVWERGSGRTMACGTGACASFVAAHHLGLIEASANVVLDGGVLKVSHKQNHIFMKGSATKVFTGEIGAKELNNICDSFDIVEEIKQKQRD